MGQNAPGAMNPIRMSRREFDRLLNHARRIRLVLVLSEDEHRELVMAALRAKQKTADYARRLLLDALEEYEVSGREFLPRTTN